MKIYGQEFREVFKALPWQYKIVVTVGAAFVVFVAIYVPVVMLGRSLAVEVATIEPLRFSGTQPLTMSDPALATNPQDKAVWMAYTAAEPSSSGQNLHVRLAGTSAGNGCKIWRSITAGFEGRADNLLGPDGQTVFRTGAWRVETPALVYDPDDPGREWKLYAYKYFWADNPRHRLQVAQHYGMIVYKYASDPAKEWSTEQWLFSPGPDYPPPPYDRLVLTPLNRLDPGLKDVVSYSRPSVIYKQGALVMTLSAFTQGMTPDRIIMIASPDHGKNWIYVGTVLRQADVPAIGSYTKLAGAALIEKDGRVFLVAVLGDEQQRGKGTFIFGFADFSKGILQRDAKGTPAVIQHIPLQNPAAGGVGGGFAAYSAACPFGLLTAEQKTLRAEFQIFKTYVEPAVSEEGE